MLGEGLELGVVDIGNALEANKQAKVEAHAGGRAQLASNEHFSVQAPVPGRHDAAAQGRRRDRARDADDGAVRQRAASAALSSAARRAYRPSSASELSGAAPARIGARLHARLRPALPPAEALVNDDGDAAALRRPGEGLGHRRRRRSARRPGRVGAPFLKALPGVRGACRRSASTRRRRRPVSVGRAAMQRSPSTAGTSSPARWRWPGSRRSTPRRRSSPSSRTAQIPTGAQVTDAAAEGFKSGLLLAPLSVIEPPRLPPRRRPHPRRPPRGGSSRPLAHAAKDLGIVKVAPAEAERVIGQMAAGTDDQTVFVNPEHARRGEGSVSARSSGPSDGRGRRRPRATSPSRSRPT
jgi:hypothetical protein